MATRKSTVCGAVRTIVVVALALMASCSWFLFRWHAYRLEQNAIQKLLASGTDVDVVPASTFLGVPLCDPEVCLTFHGQVGSVSLRDVRNLRGIEFEDCIVPAETFRQLRRPGRLRSLIVHGGSIEETAWAEFHRLTGLQWVFFTDVALKDEHLTHVGALKQMDMLHLRNNGLSDDAMRYLRPAPVLQHLHISGNPIRGSGLRWLGDLPSLRILDLPKCPLRADEIGHIKGIRSLESLWLTDESCNEDVLRVVLGVPSITYLSLSSQNVTDEMVMKLPLKGLGGLNLRDTNVTRKGLDALKKKFPHVRVEDSLSDPPQNKADDG